MKTRRIIYACLVLVLTAFEGVCICVQVCVCVYVCVCVCVCVVIGRYTACNNTVGGHTCDV